MRSHETLADLVMKRQPDDADTSREAGVICEIIKAHYDNAGGSAFDNKVIEIIEDAYVFIDFQEESE